MKIAVILGTRPEIIKMSPVIRALDVRSTALNVSGKENGTLNVERQMLNYFIIHLDQHFS